MSTELPLPAQHCIKYAQRALNTRTKKFDRRCTGCRGTVRGVGGTRSAEDHNMGVTFGNVGAVPERRRERETVVREVKERRNGTHLSTRLCPVSPVACHELRGVPGASVRSVVN